VLAPIVRAQKGEHKELFNDLLKQGYIRVRVDGEIRALGSEINLDRQMRHDVEVVVDRLKVAADIRGRLSEAVESALKISKGNLVISTTNDLSAGEEVTTEVPSATAASADRIFSVDYACSPCGISFQPPTPQLFSFNSPQGMCQECDGLGHLYTFDPSLLIPDSKKSFKKGCFELLGKWSDLGRWRRHIYQGLADSIERQRELPENTL
ncbi:MAG: excinuclease ABC subunit A, partial [Planctomycetaceae bacterium]|nr:excinuclease ABC subunit A [Planctomycetaceae bacterium]